MLQGNALQWNMHRFHSFVIHNGNHIHFYKHSTCSLHSLTVNIVAEVKMDKTTYLKMNSFRNQLRCYNVPPNHRPTRSLISQQRCHPRAGHDSPRNKGTTGLHVAKDTQKHTAKPTKLGLSCHQGVGKGSMLSWWAHYRAKNTYTRTNLTSKTPKHTQHKELVPSLLHSPSGPDLPSSAIQGLWRRKPAL